ncbi:nuclear transport factor 2 family protein [Mycolicibacterium porcinum]|uniref:Nuclear transport factor 2 family protein n=1 Tax=Mycolicibacterium porcinum TaxID=39693 RepID=A0AAW5SV59_9MYCO|nr:nuclear transport factor 2 family protein [Mycolicibacterium porcinum]MCV7386462.1 nuclear transport factor 2 family protein [Mycolicibacterium porcinum]ORB39041.1 hypothetical protein BST41_18680 [Mycolicibacterium porcinum]CDO30867.1 hypothetical protein BN979_03677 [Mycolicibacterium vulneris]
MTALNESELTANDLLARLERLEAERDVRHALNDYFYLLDAGRVEDLLDVYSREVDWSASNIPFGSGRRLALTGRAQVRPVVESLGYGGFRHHGVNADIYVDDAATSAWTTSYMLVVSRSTEVPGTTLLLGGLYEGTWTRDSDRWRIGAWHISHQWMVDGVGSEKFFDGLREGTRWDGLRREEDS